MTFVMPDGVPSLGNVSTRFALSIADKTAPKLTELNAAFPASLDISGYLQAKGWKPGQDVGKGTPPRRLGQRTQYERFTTTTQKLDDLQYVISPQAAAATEGKKAYETLTEGLNAFFAERLGLDAETVDLALGQFVNIIPITLGPRIILAEDDENGDVMVMQAVSIRGKRIDNVAIVA